jgi:hypothetical protein
MKQSYPLDGVIRLGSDPADTGNGLGQHEHLIYFHMRKRSVLPKRPLLGIGVREYVVSTEREVECAGPCCPLKSPETARSIEFQISYDARCDPGNEQRLVAALGNGEEHPARVLDEYLKHELRNFARGVETGGGDFVVAFDDLKAEVDRHLRDVAARDIGISLKPDVRPRLADKLENVAVKLDAFEARPKDGEEGVLLECSTEVEVLPGARMRALLFFYDLKDLSQTLRETIRTTLSYEVALHDLVAPGKRQRTEAALIDAINRKLERQGRRIRFLRLNTALDRQPDETIEIEHEMSCRIRGSEEEIPVKHQLILTLLDTGKLVKSGIDDVGSWVKKRLSEITRTILFDKTYLDLLLRFDPEDPGEIRTLLEGEVGSVGYGVKQIMTIPGLEPLEWKDHGFLLECPDREYATADSRVKVRLEIVISGKIEDLGNEKLKRYLHPGSDLLKDVREAAETVAQRILHGVPPQRFYTEFNFSGEGQPVRTMIEEAVTALLQERFVVVGPAVIAKPAETELTKRLAHLRNGPHRTDVKVFPLRGGGLEEPVDFHITFNVLGVAENGWHVFCARSYASVEDELVTLKDEIGEQAKALFGPVPAELLIYRDFQHRLDLHRVLDSCRPNIRYTFGLEVSFVQIRRSETKAERANEEKLANNIREQLERSKKADAMTSEYQLKKLGKLHEEDLDLTKGEIGPDDPAKVNIQRNIHDLTERIHPYPAREDEKHVRALPSADEGFSLGEYHKRLLADTSTRFLLVEGDAGDDE